MTLDTSVMNVAIATVAEDVGTDVTGIQTAITLYTLVMATLMITGGKVGALIGRKRAFAIGCVIYGTGSFITSIAPSLPVLLIGWSLLEGVGAALILPAIVALVAANFGAEGRPRAYGLVMAAGAVAVAVGPLIGGLFTSYLSWRLVFAGEVLIVIGILVLTRRIADEPPGKRPKIDLVGVVLSAVGLGLAVFGVLRSSVWGWVSPKPDAPELFGLSATLWLILGGLFVVWMFFEWESRLEERGDEPLVRPSILKNTQLVAGLRVFFFQYFVQSGVFFVVPLFLSVSLGLSAIDTGVRLLPLSVTLLIAAVGIPRFRPDANPRRVVAARSGRDVGRHGRAAGRDRRGGLRRDRDPAAAAARPGNRRAGLPARQRRGVGRARRAQPRGRRASEHGHQPRRVARNRAGRLGPDRQPHCDAPVRASSRTRLSRPSVSDRADVKLASGVPFLSDADLESALDEAGVPNKAASAIVDENSTARLSALRGALAVIAIVAALALFFSNGIPTRQPGSTAADAQRAPPRLGEAVA